MNHIDGNDLCYTPDTPIEPIFDGDFSFNTGKTNDFTLLDFLVFGLSLTIPVFIGIYYVLRTRFKMDLEEYMLAKHSMSSLPVGISMMTTYFSANSMLGVPVEVYIHNALYAWITLAFLLLVIPASSYIYVPVFYQLKINSIYEYLELRFSRTVRTVVAITFIVQTLVFLAISLYSPSIAFNSVSGLNYWGAMITVAIVCIFYVSLGGIKGVVYTDCFQFILMALSIVPFLAQADSIIGTTHVLESANKRNIFAYDFRLNPAVRHTIWNLVIGGGITFLCMWSANQAQVQRALACRSLQEAQAAYWISLPASYFVFFGLTAIGVYMSVFYENCDPIQAKLVKRPYEMTMFFMQDILDLPGLQGLFLAGVFGASLSTVSTGLNSVALVILEDFIRVFCQAQIPRNRERLISQIISFICGIFCVELAHLGHKTGGSLQAALRVLGMLSGPTLGIFSLGMFIPWANEKGALFGFIGGIVLTVLLGFLPQLSTDMDAVRCVSNCNTTSFSNVSRNALMHLNVPENKGEEELFGLSYMWLPFIGCVSSILFALIVSTITGNRDPTDADPRLIVPFLDVAFPFYYLPERAKERFRYGIDHGNKFKERRTVPNSEGMNTETDQHGTDKSDTSFPRSFHADVDDPQYKTTAATKRRESSGSNFETILW